MSREFEVLKLLAVCDRIEGRKKLQKLVHILKEAGFPFKFRYGYHFHGPFSSELKAGIDALVADGMVQEEEGETFSGDHRQFTYRLDDSARAFLPSAIAPDWAALARSLNEKSPKELEAISTVIFLMREGCDDARLRERFLLLKPHLSHQMPSALQAAQRLISKQATVRR